MSDTTFGISNKWWRAFGFAFGAMQNPENGIQRSGGGGAVEAGVAVNDERAMQNSTFWRCVRLIVETVGSMPLTFARVVEGERVELVDHYIVDLLKYSPNAMMNALEFREAMTACLTIWGNAYAYIAWKGSRISSITPLRPDKMQVIRMHGQMTYHFTHDEGVVVYSAKSILHIKGFGTDGIVGLSALAYARQSLGIAIAADNYAARTFAKGGRPTGVLSFDKFLNAETRAGAKILYESMVSDDNVDVPLILEGGSKYEAISIPPDDMQMLQTRAFSISDIARFFGIPSHMLNDSEKSTTFGTGIEEINLAMLAYTVRPYLTRIEACIKDKLLLPTERDLIVVEHNVEGLLRSNSKARGEFYQIMLRNAVYSRNEVRRKENLPPIDGGDKFTVESNLMDLAQVGKIPATPTDPTVTPNVAS